MSEPRVYLKAEVEAFFWLARERYQIKLRKDAGEPRPWTQDRLLQRYHFCNVFRVDDRVSRAIHALADAWSDPFQAVLQGRLCNKEATILALGQRCRYPATSTPFGDICREQGINTNAYRLNTPLGLNNVDGLVALLKRANTDRPELREELQAAPNVPAALRCLGPYLNGFVGYQIVLDLVDLGWFPSTFDSSFAWPGPGAVRGALRVAGIPFDDQWESRARRGLFTPEQLAVYHRVLAHLHRKAGEERYWPWTERPWSIHEVEFMMCEYDKYTRKGPALERGERVSGRLYK